MAEIKSKKKVNRRADATLFGFDFQVNAAIVIMLDNIENMKSIRLESENEDIEIKCNDDSLILAQAKAVEKGESDFKHVKENLKKALVSLSEGSYGKKIEKIIYVTNSVNPLGDKRTMMSFIGLSRRSYEDLPPQAQKIIDEYMSNISESLDKSKLWIQTIPFYTDCEEERYKVIKGCIDDFIGRLNILSTGLKDKLFEVWNTTIFQNGSKHDATITIKKADVIWPIIMIATDIKTNDDYFSDDFDDAEIDEITHYYGDLINNCIEKFSFLNRVISDYGCFSFKGNTKEKCHKFAFTKWKKYEKEFKFTTMDSKTRENVIKVIIYQILRRRFLVNKVKEAVKL